MAIELSQVTLLRRKQVEEITSLSRSTIYAMIAKGSFPKPVRLGPQRVAWRQMDVVSWLESCSANAA
ncbi:helix-turn-helix transcriptional regulator [Aeromonas sp. D3]|uniref:helix-turn-helix transcriptional regulator n=1 Tax=Aeromonas sp. D3 TaxID=2990474 RepID=UPI0022E8EC8E|nr:AlpA family phage regulatory protein [Aeromonas sp. D3]